MSDKPAFRALDAIVSTPWAMTEDGIQLLCEIASRTHEISPEAIEAMKARRVAGGDSLAIRDGVGIISARGPMFRYADMFSAISGAATYEGIASDLGLAEHNPAIRAVIMSIDSPGGEVNGLSELAQAVRKLSAKKPVYAYVGGMGASAGYWLASSTLAVYANELSIVGSIGVRMGMTDSSERDAKSGVKRYEFISSQSPDKASDPTSDEGRAKIQRTVDAMGAVFVKAVAEFRGVSEQEVLSKFGRGGVEVGADAVAAGMIDGLMSFEDLVAKVSRSEIVARPKAPAASSKGTKSMTDISKADHEAAVAAALKSGTDAGAKAAQTRISAILGLESAKGRDDLARHFAFNTDMTTEAADAALKVAPAAAAPVAPPADPKTPPAPQGTRTKDDPNGLLGIEPPPAPPAPKKTLANVDRRSLFAKV